MLGHTGIREIPISQMGRGVAGTRRILALAESHLSRDLRRAVDKLTKRQREAVLLVYIIGLTETEASERLRISQPATARLLSRSLKTLRKIYSDAGV